MTTPTLREQILVPIDALVPYARSARTHSAAPRGDGVSKRDAIGSGATNPPQLTPLSHRGHAIRAAVTTAAGIGIPSEAAKAAQRLSCGFFVPACPVMGDRTGGAARPAGASPVCQLPFRSPTLIGIRWAASQPQRGIP